LPTSRRSRAISRPESGAEEHVPGALGQVVRLVDEERAVVFPEKEPLESVARVEGVVVVADDDVGRLGQPKGELEGAEGVFLRQIPMAAWSSLCMSSARTSAARWRSK
jgi:hypothetical protein